MFVNELTSIIIKLNHDQMHDNKIFQTCGDSFLLQSIFSLIVVGTAFKPSLTGRALASCS